MKIHMKKKAKTDIVVSLSNASNNALKLCSIVVSDLKSNGYESYANEISRKICGLHSKSEAVSIFREYVIVK